MADELLKRKKKVKSQAPEARARNCTKCEKMTEQENECYSCIVKAKAHPDILKTHLTCGECEDYTRGWEWRDGVKYTICFHCYMLMDLFKVQDELAKGTLKAYPKKSELVE